MIKTIGYEDGHLYILNQTMLPEHYSYELCDSLEDMAVAIRELRLRGAPLIGVGAAYGLALAVRDYRGNQSDLNLYYEKAEQLIGATRPTAVNLFYAIERQHRVFTARQGQPPAVVFAALLAEAECMYREDRQSNFALGEHGQTLLPAEATVMTICNAGALATCGYGTALGIIRSAHRRGKIKMVWVCETRPLLQGARLTAWELMQDRVPVTLITDSMASSVMARHKVNAVIIGADRIAANGDTANKIGSSGLAVLAHYYAIPFYVAAPLSTIDTNLGNGDDIPIEERDVNEVRRYGGCQLGPAEVAVFNPAFDVTQQALISAIVTEAGILWPPYPVSISRALGGEGCES